MKSIQKEISKIQFRASGAAEILTGSIDTITERQLSELKTLESERDTGLNANGNKVKWTENKEKTLAELIAKRDKKPELPVGAKSYVERCVNEIVYKYKSFTGNKETEKGHLVEQDSIDLANDVLIQDWKKSESYLTYGHYHGHPDIEDDAVKQIQDIKSPWSKSTFKQRPEDAFVSKYDWQVKIYLYLKSKLTKEDWRTGNIVHCLVDTPESLLTDFDDDSAHEVSDVPKHMRVTVVPVEMTDKDVEMIEKRGQMAYDYAQEYFEFLINKNQ